MVQEKPEQNQPFVGRQQPCTGTVLKVSGRRSEASQSRTRSIGFSSTTHWTLEGVVQAPEVFLYAKAKPIQTQVDRREYLEAGGTWSLFARHPPARRLPLT